MTAGLWHNDNSTNKCGHFANNSVDNLWISGENWGIDVAENSDAARFQAGAEISAHLWRKVSKDARIQIRNHLAIGGRY